MQANLNDGCQPRDLVLISDPGKDPDDSLALVLAIALQDLGYIRVRGVVTTVGASSIRRMRARHAKWLLAQLGARNTEVVEGASYPIPDRLSHAHNSFLRSANVQSESDMQPSPASSNADRFAAYFEKDVTVVVLGGLTDLANWLADRASGIWSSVNRVVVMGGATRGSAPEKHLVSDSHAFNNAVDIFSTNTVFELCGELGIPLTVVSREAIYSSPSSIRFVEDLRLTGHECGICIAEMYRESYSKLWDLVSGELIGEDRDRRWFLDTFTDSSDRLRRAARDSTLDIPFEEVFSSVRRVMLYDPIALYFAVPEIWPKSVADAVASRTLGKQCIINDSLDNCLDGVRQTVQKLVRRKLLS